MNNTKARSMVLTALVIVAIGTTVLSALYVGGLVGHSQTKQEQQTTNTAIAPGGYMLVRNATFTPCITTSTTVNNTTMTNSTSTETTTCMPIGMG